MFLFSSRSRFPVRRISGSLLLGAILIATPMTSAQTVDNLTPSSGAPISLPDAPRPQSTTRRISPLDPGAKQREQPTISGTPKRIVSDELHIITSPVRIRTHDLIWLLPVAGATAASLATDTHTIRDVVSHDPSFNASNVTSSDVLRDLFIGGPVALFGVGQFLGKVKEREAGLLAGEAMIDSYVTSEGVKYITLRERPYVQNGRGYFFQGDASSDPSFVSGHSIVAWSSAAVLAAEYSKPWQQVGFYTLATGVSLTRVLGQQHFPTDVLLDPSPGGLSAGMCTARITLVLPDKQEQGRHYGLGAALVEEGLGCGWGFCGGGGRSSCFTSSTS